MNARARLRQPEAAPGSPAAEAAPVQRSAAVGAPALMRLQQTAGNRAVQRQVREAGARIQRADDEYTQYKPMPAAPAGPAADSSESEYRVSPHLPPAGTDSSYTAYTPMPGGPAASPTAEASPGPSAAAGPTGPAPLKLPEKFKDEDKKFGWRAFYGTDPDKMDPAERADRERVAARTNVITKYNSPEEIAQNTLSPTGEGPAKKLTTASGDAASFRPIEYAMGTGGQVVGNLSGRQSNMLPTGQKQTIHHSTMLAGADVAHAGHIGAQDGEVNYLDDDSGHYRPTEAHTFDAFNRLAGQGVLNPNSATGRVNLVDKQGVKGVNRGESASVHFSGYQQSGGNERGIRNKAAMLTELQQKVPRYEQPEAPVPAPGPAADRSQYAVSPHEPPEGALALDETPEVVSPPGPVAGPGYAVSPHAPPEGAPELEETPEVVPPPVPAPGYTLSPHQPR